jgi:hypothetical protein
VAVCGVPIAWGRCCGYNCFKIVCIGRQECNTRWNGLTYGSTSANGLQVIASANEIVRIGGNINWKNICDWWGANVIQVTSITIDPPWSEPLLGNLGVKGTLLVELSRPCNTPSNLVVVVWVGKLDWWQGSGIGLCVLSEDVHGVYSAGFDLGPEWCKRSEGGSRVVSSGCWHSKFKLL